MIIDNLHIIMFAATVVFLLRGYPVAFTLAGVGLLFAFIAQMTGNHYWVDNGGFDFLKFYPSRIFGNYDETNEVLLAVPLFIFMGVMLERSNVAGELLSTMGRLFGSMRGGLGLSVSIVGMLLAASTGIVGATVVTMGLISLPTMLKHNYSKSLACGSIAAAGTLGQIIPPSIVLVILGDQISNAYIDARRASGDSAPDPISVGDLFAGALIPGLMLVELYIAYQLIVALFLPETSPAMDDEERPSFGEILGVLLPPITLIIAVLGSILTGIATPTEAAAVGAVGAILLAAARTPGEASWPMQATVMAIVAILVLTLFFDLRLTRDVIEPRDQIGINIAYFLCGAIALGLLVAIVRVGQSGVLTDVMRSTTKVTSMVFMILVGAALFSLVFRGLGGEELVHEMLSDIHFESLGLSPEHSALLVVMLVMFVLGFFLDFLEIVFVVVPLVAPVLFSGEVGLDPVWVAVLIAINLQTSFLTPPFGFALFYLRGVAPSSVSTMDIYKGVIPFVILQLIGLLIVAFYPSLATWLPEYIFG